MTAFKWFNQEFLLELVWGFDQICACINESLLDELSYHTQDYTNEGGGNHRWVA